MSEYTPSQSSACLPLVDAVKELSDCSGYNSAVLEFGHAEADSKALIVT